MLFNVIWVAPEVISNLPANYDDLASAVAERSRRASPGLVCLEAPALASAGDSSTLSTGNIVSASRVS